MHAINSLPKSRLSSLVLGRERFDSRKRQVSLGSLGGRLREVRLNPFFCLVTGLRLQLATSMLHTREGRYKRVNLPPP